MRRVKRGAIGDAALEIAREERDKGEKAGVWFVGYGDCYRLDDIARRSGFSDLHPMYPLDRHKRILDALERDGRFVKWYFRGHVNNRERLLRFFKIKEGVL